MPNGWADFQHAWPGSLPPDDLSGDEVLRINAAPVNVEELKNLIQNSRGVFITDVGTNAERIARANWFWFRTRELRDGRIEITESNYLLYGGLGLGALLLLALARGR